LVESKIPSAEEGMFGVGEVECFDGERPGGFEALAVLVDRIDIDDKALLFAGVGRIGGAGEFAEGDAVGGEELGELRWGKSRDGGLALLVGAEDVALEDVLFLRVGELFGEGLVLFAEFDVGSAGRAAAEGRGERGQE
jgi:hypothetical protein